jgi:type IV pilus assembly protein PilA
MFKGNFMAHLRKGFTLIELMIVIAIIALLASLGLPMYQDYTVRAKVTEFILVAGPAKIAVTAAVQVANEMPSALALDAQSTQYVDSVAYARDAANAKIGTITVTAKEQPRIGGKKLELKATLADTGQLSWSCGPAATDGIDAKYLPASCK